MLYYNMDIILIINYPFNRSSFQYSRLICIGFNFKIDSIEGCQNLWKSVMSWDIWMDSLNYWQRPLCWQPSWISLVETDMLESSNTATPTSDVFIYKWFFLRVILYLTDLLGYSANIMSKFLLSEPILYSYITYYWLQNYLEDRFRNVWKYFFDKFVFFILKLDFD